MMVQKDQTSSKYNATDARQNIQAMHRNSARNKNNVEKTESAESLKTSETSGSSSSESETIGIKISKSFVKTESESKSSLTLNLSEEKILSAVASLENCTSCDARSIYEVLSHENMRLCEKIKSKDKKLQIAKQQLNEERLFYEQEKMDLRQMILRKKNKKTQSVQANLDRTESERKLLKMEEEIASLKSQLSGEVKKSHRLTLKYDYLKRKNEKLETQLLEIEKDCAKSWDDITRSSMNSRMRAGGDCPSDDTLMKKAYEDILKKTSSLKLKNEALREKNKFLRHQLEKIETSAPLVSTRSSPELGRKERRGRHKKDSMTQQLSEESSAEEFPKNLVISGSLISVPMKGSIGKLRPVFLVLEEPEAMRLDWRQLGVGVECKSTTQEELKSPLSIPSSEEEVEEEESARSDDIPIPSAESKVTFILPSREVIAKNSVSEINEISASLEGNATMTDISFTETESHPSKTDLSTTTSLVECTIHSPSIQ